MKLNIKKTTISLCLGALLMGSSALGALEFTSTDSSVVNGDATAFTMLARSCVPIDTTGTNDTNDTNTTNT